MPVGATIGAVGALGSAGIGYLGSTSAMNKQVGAMQSMYNQGLSLNQPFIQAGQSALPTLQNLLTPGPNQTATLNQLPGFQFAQDWGQKGVQNIGTTLGLGGNTLAAGAQFATGTAQQNFTNYVSQLQQFANMGSGSAANAFGQANQAGANIGNALGAGTMGQYNALAGGVQGASNAFALPYALNAFKAGGNTNAGIYGGNTFEAGQVAQGAQVM